MLDRLETGGYLKRVPSGQDRRRIQICLTDKNRHLQDLYNKVSDEMTGIFYDGLDDAEINQFEDCLKRIFKNLNGGFYSRQDTGNN